MVPASGLQGCGPRPGTRAVVLTLGPQGCGPQGAPGSASFYPPGTSVIKYRLIFCSSPGRPKFHPQPGPQGRGPRFGTTVMLSPGRTGLCVCSSPKDVRHRIRVRTSVSHAAGLGSIPGRDHGAVVPAPGPRSCGPRLGTTGLCSPGHTGQCVFALPETSMTE